LSTFQVHDVRTPLFSKEGLGEIFRVARYFVRQQIPLDSPLYRPET
jgi:hypothetical protein